ncbi:hypothetical protein [Paucibacter sp. XJ19-41]|nr:hypothetical protein [Paucibacter sp. XJ19-41]MDC6166082.1 hypothetical protein [Paucibacter sp. XJ19-41]
MGTNWFRVLKKRAAQQSGINEISIDCARPKIAEDADLRDMLLPTA